MQSPGSLWISNQVVTCISGLTKPGKVGEFFALVSMKSSNFSQEAKF